jgi:hypothetical protein
VPRSDARPRPIFLGLENHQGVDAGLNGFESHEIDPEAAGAACLDNY